MKSLDVLRLEIQTAPSTWVNLTAPAGSISITRVDGDVGTMDATLADVTLDPTVSSTLRFGRLVRVSAQQGSGWKVIYTGTVETIDVDYHPLDRHSVRVTVTSTDNVAYLANVSERRGVATGTGLRWLLTEAGVPYLVNGSSAPGTPQTVVATNDSASLWDQILSTRDSRLGYAWVDQENRLRWYDEGSMSTTPVATLTTAEYRDVEVDFNSGQIINSVTVNFLRYAPTSDTTTEIAYGPYEDAASIAEWGRYAATVTYQGLTEDEPTLAAFAQDILDRNSTGEIRVKSVTIPINDEALLPLTYIDLNQFVTVVLTDNTETKTLRVSGVSHEVTGDRWYVTLTLDVPGGIAPPSTPPSTGVSIIPEGSVGTPQIQPGAVGTNEISFQASDIGGITTTLSPTSPTGAVEGDLWIDQDNGNTLMRWDGTQWVNVKDAAIQAAKNAADLALADAVQAVNDAYSAKNAAILAQSDATTAFNAANDALSMADDALTTADGKSKVYYSTSTPSVTGVEGDLWYRLNSSDEVTGLWQFKSGGWYFVSLTNEVIAAETIITSKLAANAITTDKLAANAITAKHSITGALFQTTATANRGVKITSGGLVGYDAAGQPTLALDAVTGALSLKGSITSGSTISGAEISGGTITGGTITGGSITGTTVTGTVITGGVYQSALTGERLTIDSTTADKSRIVFHHGQSAALRPGYIEADVIGTYGSGTWGSYVWVVGPSTSDLPKESPRVILGKNHTTSDTQASLMAERVSLTAEGVGGQVSLSANGTIELNTNSGVKITTTGGGGGGRMLYGPGYDTGWQNLTAGSGWTLTGAQYRIIGGVVYIRGRASRSSGSNNTITTLPVEARPASAIYCYARSGTQTNININTSGTIVAGSGYSNGNNLELTSLPSYPLG